MAAKANRKANGIVNNNGALRVLVVGVGNMGLSHARAYDDDRRLRARRAVRPDASPSAPTCRRLVVRAPLHRFRRGARSRSSRTSSRSTPIRTRMPTTPSAPFEAGAHVFWKSRSPRRSTDAERVVAAARGARPQAGRRLHPARPPVLGAFVELARTLGKPLVMRMNLNQQSIGAPGPGTRNLMKSLSPIVDCGVHYVDVMCQMTGARPVRVHGIGARLTDDVKVSNYGHLHVEFDDGSVGWYEAGWGPMMSEVAVLREGRGRPEGLRSASSRPSRRRDRRGGPKASPTSTATPRQTRSACTMRRSTQTMRSPRPTSVPHGRRARSP